MFGKKIFTKDMLLFIFSVASGLWAGLIIVVICTYFNLYILGVNIDIFIAPVVSGFVETFVSNFTRKKSSGAISSIILFVLTNGLGWLFPQNPITLSVFTIGGIVLMLQAAFPLLMNYLLLSLIFSITYVFGVVGSLIGLKIKSNEITMLKADDIEKLEEPDVYIFNTKPAVPIKEYHGLIFAEDVVEFEEKNAKEKMEYLGADIENKNILKHQDYTLARTYILHQLKKEALEVNANAIIDVQFEYTNYNQQLPPDVVIAAYGGAVTIDKKYLN